MFTPAEMLSKGIFGGTYFYELIDYQDYPPEWFMDLSPEQYRSEVYRKDVNLYKVKCGASQAHWEQKGWIHKDDPRGWFEWYCKYYLGRRHEDDERQIKRWLAFCGPKGRFRNNIYKQMKDTYNESLSPRIQQSLLHWSYQINEKDFHSYRRAIVNNP